MATKLLPEGPLAAEPDVLDRWEVGLAELFTVTYRPAPRISLSEWADQHGRLSDGMRWDTSVVPYLREPMDATTDRRVREVVIMKASRVGYTEGLVGQRVGFVMHQDPERMLVVLPTKDDAEDWSKDQLSKMIEQSPTLREILPESRGRQSGNTILKKSFTGGSITIRGGHSPKGLRRITARDVLIDEGDGFELSAGKEGDPLWLAERANRTLPDRKTIKGSTPTLAGSSRIFKDLKTSDWREAHVPCPHCTELQVLEWGGPDEDYGIKWLKDLHCKGCGVEVPSDATDCPECGSQEFEATHQPETAHYVCRHCHGAIEEHHKPWMIQFEHEGGLARWVPRYPGRAKRGYHISGLLSPFEGASWKEMVKKFLEAKDDPALRQVWTNSWLGLPFEDHGKKVEVKELEARTEQYVDAEGQIAEVPDGVGVLMAGVDVQHDRLELLVRGYGTRWQTWDLIHERIPGAPQSADTWARLDHHLLRAYRHQFGQDLHIQAGMIDSGDGNTNEYVYRFVKPREVRNVWASKGDNAKPSNPPLKRPTKPNADNVLVWTIGTFAAKSSLLYRLLKVTRPGPNYIHLREYTPKLCNGFDAEYFAQFEAEEKKLVRVKGTNRYEERFIQTRARNEAIDLHVLADSAFRAWGGARVEDMMPELVEQARQPPDPPEEPDETPRRSQDDGGDWLYGWKR